MVRVAEGGICGGRGMRLIDGDALWVEIIHRMDYCDDILEIIESMPTIEPEQRWIPCSDCERKCDKWENSKT